MTIKYQRNDNKISSALLWGREKFLIQEISLLFAYVEYIANRTLAWQYEVKLRVRWRILNNSVISVIFLNLTRIMHILHNMCTLWLRVTDFLEFETERNGVYDIMLHAS
jgi:hypothetical protein